MSHRTAATALLLASLPYGFALPHVIPLVSELAPNVTPSPLLLVPAVNASTVTVVGTIIQPAVESAVEDVTDAIEDATETVASALESATDAVEGALPTDAPSILDPEANILPLILPGILPVEADLPPVDAPDVVPSDLPILDPGIGDGTFPGDDLPDTNDLEVIDLPVPSEVPYGDDGLIAEPYFPDFNDEATVPISTFNAVVQPLLSVIQTLLNSLPGNFAPPLPGIFPHPLLPTETPEIFIDPLLPTETFDDAVATATDAVDSLIDPLVDPISTNSIAADLPFAKRQAPADVDTNSILELIAPILEAINALIAQIPIVGPAVSGVVSDVESAAPELPADVPALPIAAPELPLPNITLPNLPLPPVPATDVQPTDDLPVNVPAPALPELSLTTPPALSDLTSGIPDEVLNVPVPDDIEGIDWAAFESPPFSDLPAPSPGDIAIPDDILNVPVSDFDENGLPTGTVVDAVSDAATAVPAALPTSLDAFGDLPDDLLDWPFSDIPEAFAPDVNGELPDLEDFPIPDDVLKVPVPDLDDLGIPLDLPTGLAGGLLADPLASLPLPTDLLEAAAPTELLDASVPTNLLDVPVPTDLLDVPVPEGFEDIAVPTDTVTALPAAPSLGDLADFPIPDDILNIPWPELDENGIPIDLPVDPVDGLAAPPAALPTNLNWFDIPVPDDWVDLDDISSILPAPTASTAVVPDVLPAAETLDDILNIPGPDLDENGLPVDLPAPALPTEDFGAGFPIQALPDVPLILPAVSDVAPAVPTDNLLPVKGPAALTEALTDVPTDALSGLPTSILADVSALPTDAVPAVTDLPIVAPALPAVAAPALPAVPAVKLPFQVPGARGPLGKRQFPNLLAQTKLPVNKPPAAAPAASPVNTVAISLVKPLLSLVSSLLAKLSVVGQTVPNLGATLPNISTLVPTPPLPAVPGAPDVASILPASVPDVSGLVGGVLPSLVAPDIASILPAPAGLSNPGGVVSAVTGAVSGVPAVGDVASTVTGPLAGDAPALPDVAGVVSTVASAVPAGLLPSLGGKLKKRQLGPLSGLLTKVPFLGGVAATAPAVPNLSGLTSTVTGAVNNVPPGGGLASGAVHAAPNVEGLASTVTSAVSNAPFAGGIDGGAVPALGGGALSGVGGLTSTVTGAVKAVPGTGEVASTVIGAVPKVPLAFDSGLTKTLIPADLPLNPSVLLDAIKPLLSIIESIVNALPLSAAGLPLGKRDATTLPIDPEIIFRIISPLLQLVNKLVETVPAPVPELPAVTNIVTGLQKRGVVTELPDLPVPLDISVIVTIIKPLLDLATGLLTKLPAPVSSVVSTLPVNNTLGGLLGKRDAAAIPGLDILSSIIKPLLALVNSLLEKSPVPLPLQVPDVNIDSIVGGLTKRQLETVTSALDPAGTVSLVESLIQTILGLLNVLPINPATILPKLPLSSLGKRQLDNLPLQPNQIVGLVKPILSLITSLLETFAPTVSSAASSLPAPVKRQALGIDPAAITSTVVPLQSLIGPAAALEILPPLLRVLSQLIAGLPLAAVQQVPLVNTLGNLSKRQLGGGLGGLNGGAASADATQALSILPGLLNLLSGLLGSLNLPVNPVSIVAGASAPVLDTALNAAAPVLNVAGPVAAPVLGAATPVLNTATSAVAPVASIAGSLTSTVGSLKGTAGGLANPLGGLTSTLGGLTKTIPISQPLARRAIEEFQQGPASDWESFLGELDESKQSELTGLIHDSAKAVNNDDLDALADTLKSDFHGLSDNTKTTLLEGFGAKTFGKRSMRHAKRQEFSGVPGVQSVGPNLDDAQKVDLSGFPPLDPNNQLQGLAAAGTPVDSARPPPRGSFEQLAGSSVGAGSDPELAMILANGGLDPNGMLSNPVVGSPVDEPEDPYSDLRQHLEPAFGTSKPLEGLDATLQAAKNNHFSGKKPNFPFVPQAGGSAAAQQAGIAAKQQGNVLQWFQRFVKPSWNKDVDAEIVR